MPSDWSLLSAGNKMANAQQYLPKSTALRTDLQRNKVAQPSSKLSEQHKMARLFTGERNEKQKRKNQPISSRAIMHLSAAGIAAISVIHI